MADGTGTPLPLQVPGLRGRTAQVTSNRVHVCKLGRRPRWPREHLRGSFPGEGKAVRQVPQDLQVGESCSTVWRAGVAGPDSVCDRRWGGQGHSSDGWYRWGSIAQTCPVSHVHCLPVTDFHREAEALREGGEGPSGGGRAQWR